MRKENSTPSLFNKNLRFLREKHNMSALSFSKKLNIAWATYAAYELSTWPRPETLIAISDFFNISIDDMVKVDLSAQTPEMPAAKANNLIELLSTKDELISTQRSLINELKEKKINS
jgi:transcriptional regulator with XRE-family HTH domain